METVTPCLSIENARNSAVRWLEERGVVFGPRRELVTGRLGVLTGKEVGVSASESPYWRIRLDYDPLKGPHFNTEYGKGPERQKAAFAFPGTEADIAAIAKNRSPR
jgi:hypothetical protein